MSKKNYKKSLIKDLKDLIKMLDKDVVDVITNINTVVSESRRLSNEDKTLTKEQCDSILNLATKVEDDLSNFEKQRLELREFAQGLVAKENVKVNIDALAIDSFALANNSTQLFVNLGDYYSFMANEFRKIVNVQDNEQVVDGEQDGK